MRQRDGGNQEIIATDAAALSFEKVADAGVLRHARRVEGERLKRLEKSIEHRLALGRAVILGGTVTTAARTLTLGAGGGVIDTNGNDVNCNSGSTVTGTTLTKTGSGTLNFGLLSGLTGLGALAANDGATNVHSVLGTGGTSTISASGTASVKFGSVSQTLRSLTIGAGATVTFTSGLAAFSGGGNSPGFGATVVPEPAPSACC